MERKELTRRVIDGVEVTEGSDNVFADLGLPDAEALLAKAELARQLSEAGARTRQDRNDGRRGSG
jgi:hypothetical protein